LRVEHVFVLVEEPSMAAALAAILPKLLGPTTFELITFDSKKELLKRLPDRLRGYARWMPATSRIVVVVDRDADDCHELKARLDAMARQAGLATRSGGATWRVVNRLAIEELEAWFFGDWRAVRTAFPRVSDGVSRKATYRDPDAIAGGTWEAFERELKRAGYHSTGLRKIEAARAIAPHMDPARNTSRSFHVLRNALLEMGAP
jgi:hypothetical protein